MQDFLSRLLGRSAKSTSSLAKERLQFVLIHDRINIPPERMEEMKREILAVIAKYVTIDDHNVDIGLQSRDRLNLLVAEVPFVKPIDAPPEMDENDDLPDQPEAEADDAKNSSAKAG